MIPGGSNNAGPNAIAPRTLSATGVLWDTDSMPTLKKGKGVVHIQIQTTATVVIEGTLDNGVTWIAQVITQLGIVAVTQALQATASAQYSFDALLPRYRARVSAWAAGTVAAPVSIT